MAQAGFELDFSTEGWSCIGFQGVLPKLLEGIIRGRRVVRRIWEERPELVILVDFAAFNVGWAHRIQMFRPEQKVMYYFPPASWRRRPGNWTHLAEHVHVVATPFRWSAEQLRDAGIRAYWVGHPILDRLPAGVDAAAFRREQGLPDGAPVFGLMAGSRRAERLQIGPRLVRAARLLRHDFPQAHFLWSVWDPKDPVWADREAQRADFMTPVADSRSLILASDLLVVASGTATLECAAALRPMVMVYTGSLPVQIQARLMNLGTRYFALPNIIAEEPVVPELIFAGSCPERICDEVGRLAAEAGRYDKMRERLGQVREMLGTPGASRRTAQIAAATILRGVEGLPDSLEWPEGSDGPGRVS